MIIIVHLVVKLNKLNMNILQFKFANLQEEDYDIIPKFCSWLNDIIYSEIDTTLNRFKINLRINYIYKVSWIYWIKPYITTQEIMDSIQQSLTYIQQKDNVWKIKIDTGICIPNTNTSIDRLIRFLEYGDTKNNGMFIFNKVQHKYNYSKLNSLWRIYNIQELGYVTESYIMCI